MSETIQLENESYLVVRNLPEDLANSLRQDFDKMFDLHPKNRGVVITIDPVTKLPVDHLCRRWFQSYLNTPKWDPTQNHNSYMFSGVDPEPQPELPYEFHDVFSYLGYHLVSEHFSKYIDLPFCLHYVYLLYTTYDRASSFSKSSST